MSSAGQGGEGGNKQSVFSKFTRRASKVLKSSNRRDTSGPVSEVSPSAVPSGAINLAVPKTRSTSLAVQQPKPTMQSTEKMVVPPNTSSAYNKLQEEKARILFAKYGLTLDMSEWTPPSTGDTQMVEKKIRMRVHRQCHRCQTTFGVEKLCSSCGHTRCKKCPRYPTKRPKDSESKLASVGVVPIVIDTGSRPETVKTRTKSLAMPSKATGNEMIRKMQVHRVRRNCHKCDALFIGKAVQCDSCKHSRCPKCPRDPPKPKKFPSGYPGDQEETYPLAQRQLRAIRTRTKWECHECSTFFTEHAKMCDKCQHVRCDQCKRHPPKRTKPEPDPALIQGVEEKLARLDMSPAA